MPFGMPQSAHRNGGRAQDEVSLGNGLLENQGRAKPNRQEVMGNVLGWLAVATVNVTLKCHPIDFPVPCAEALLLCVSVSVRFLFYLRAVRIPAQSAFVTDDVHTSFSLL